jgi:phosphate transport system substrate-binding protein
LNQIELSQSPKSGTRLGELGVKAASTVGFCDDLPVASNDTEDGRQTNRRVEVWLKIKQKRMQ